MQNIFGIPKSSAKKKTKFLLIYTQIELDFELKSIKLSQVSP